MKVNPVNQSKTSDSVPKKNKKITPYKKKFDNSDGDKTFDDYLKKAISDKDSK